MHASHGGVRSDALREHFVRSVRVMQCSIVIVMSGCLTLATIFGLTVAQDEAMALLVK